jgi:WD40 repeat protein/serine/threonine protein kinase
VPRAASRLSRPAVLGYEILDELGRGGMGVVYKARQVQLNRVVALKMILAGAHAGPQELARFRVEAEAIARLQHPNIVQVHEVGEHGGLPFFSLEFCGGGSLEKKLGGTPLPPREAARLAEVLARAMDAAHGAGIVHRDLKPANILLASGGCQPPVAAESTGGSHPPHAGNTPKITDFGLAKKLDAGTGQTASGAIIGTPSYMAPEQAGGQSKKVGPRADVYALGAILYELLTGHPPFKAATAMDTLLQVLSEEPVPVRQLQPQVPRDLETIALKCLQKQAGKRYVSAQALADDLGRFLTGEPVSARPVGRLERLSKWARRRPALASLVVVSVLAVLALIYFAATLTQEVERAERAEKNSKQEASEADSARKRAETQRDRAEYLAYVGQLSLAQREWHDGEVFRAKRLLDATQESRRGWEYRYLDTLFNHLGQRTLIRDMNGVTSICLSPNGRRLATANWTGTVRMWDALTGREILCITRYTRLLTTVCFSPDGQRLAAGSGGGDKKGQRLPGEVKVWDTATGHELLTLKGHTDRVTSVCFSPDGQRLASASLDGGLKLWDAATGHEVLSLKGHTCDIHRVCFSPDGKRLASGSGERDQQGNPLPGEVRMWDTATGQVVFTLKGHTRGVTSVCFSPDGLRLASASEDQTLIVWNAATGQEVRRVKGHTRGVTSVCFSPDGRRLASASLDNMVKVWDTATGKELLTFKGHIGGVLSVCFSPDGGRLISASNDNTVKVWDAVLGQGVLTLQAHPGGVPSVCFSPDGKRLASASGQLGKAGEVKVWDALTGQQVLSFKGHTKGATSACFSPDGRRLACASDKMVKVWDVATGHELLSLPGNIGVCFSPEGKRLVTASDDRTLKVCDAATGRLLLALQGHSASVTSVCFSPDGQRLASAGGAWDQQGMPSSGEVKVWDAATGQELLSLQGHTGPVFSVCFSPNGQCLASASDDGTVKVWDAATGQQTLTLKGYAGGGVNSVCFSPDGQRLASGSIDRTVKIWDAHKGQEVLTLKEQTGMVRSMCFSPDGKRLASASHNGTVKIWDASEGR